MSSSSSSSPLFHPLRRRRSPSLEAFLAPADLSASALINALLSLARDLLLLSSSSSSKPLFQRTNSRSLIRKVEVFIALLESLPQSGGSVYYSHTSLLCFKELFLFLSRSRTLLDYCLQSPKLWLLLQNLPISGLFNDLNQEISTLLDVLPFHDLRLTPDVREQLQLLQRQTRKARLYVDAKDEASRRRLYSFLDAFESGRVPDRLQLHSFFVEELGIWDARSCRAEIEALEEQLCSQEVDQDPPASVISGFVALARYCRFLLFGFEEDEDEAPVRKRSVGQESGDVFVSVPKDFCCPVSLELMRDPVIVSTGQTYDRSSIVRWMDEGHFTCPKTGQMLAHKILVPNRALRNLIMQWCSANGAALDLPDPSLESLAATPFSKAALEANRATAALLIKHLSEGPEETKAVAAREIRLMAKTGKENRAYMGEAGAIPHLSKLLLSQDANTQENSVTAILNLSIHERNKSKIVEEGGCLELIVNVLRFGYTTECRENAAATLFSLSAIHDYKRKIAQVEGAVEALAGLLKEGTNRGKKDAVTALFNLSTHTDNCSTMIECGAMIALVDALEVEGVSEEAAGALTLIVRQPVGAQAVGSEESAVAGLIGMMRCGSPRGKENAVAAVLELCRRGGTAVVERVLKAPALPNMLQTLLFTGTKRARRKAASLAKVFQRREHKALHYRGYAMGGSLAANRDSGYSGEITLSMSISVPVV